MERLNSLVACALLLICSCACNPDKKLSEEAIRTPPEEAEPSVQDLRHRLLDQGYEVFEYVDEKSGDTVLMQQYFIAFLKSGPNRSQSKAEADSLQRLHLAHLGKMYAEGYADISPDGTKIAFYAYNNMVTWSIYVMDIDGGNGQRLTEREGVRDSAPILLNRNWDAAAERSRR